MNQDQKNGTDGKYRLRIYDWLRNEGFDLNARRHAELKELLRGEAIRIVNPAEPVKHIYTCTKCHSEKTLVGRKQFHPFDKRMRKRGLVASAS